VDAGLCQRKGSGLSLQVAGSFRYQASNHYLDVGVRALNTSTAPRVVTVIGGTGFLGRQIVRRLAREGFRIRVTSRKPNLAYSMRPLGDVGQIALVRADIRNGAEVSAAIAGSTFVINLVGLLRPGAAGSFEQVHAEGAATVARACAKAKVARLIQISAIGADSNGNSSYARTKAHGEASALLAFPATTIFRPSIVFGNGDGFFNLFASLMRLSRGVFPLFGGGKTKFQPVFVGDVADAVVNALASDRTRGKTFELGGPAIYTLKQLVDFIAETTGRKRMLIPIPSFLLELGAALTGWLPFSPITLDQARLLRNDNIVKAGPDAASVGTLADLCVQPTAVEAVVPSYLVAYRATGQYIEPRGA
jgi:NADH dehydrogenase